MKTFEFKLGSGTRTVEGENVNLAFESLGYGKKYKVLVNGFNSWKIELSGNPGHESAYYAKLKYNHSNTIKK